MKIQLLDTVALVCDVPDFGLVAGEVGAVVELLSDDAFEVEFVDDAGYTYGLHTLRARIRWWPCTPRGTPCGDRLRRPDWLDSGKAEPEGAEMADGFGAGAEIAHGR
jgi:hypothetical protein